MDFILDISNGLQPAERYPIIGGPTRQPVRDIALSAGIRPTFKVYNLERCNTYNVVPEFAPRYWSAVYGPNERLFSRHVNQHYTSENCARKALIVCWRQFYYRTHYAENLRDADSNIELMAAVYSNNDIAWLVERRGDELRRFPATAFWLDNGFYLVQKLAAP